MPRVTHELDEELDGAVWVVTRTRVRDETDVPPELLAEYRGLMAERAKNAGEYQREVGAAYFARFEGRLAR